MCSASLWTCHMCNCPTHKILARLSDVSVGRRAASLIITRCLLKTTSSIFALRHGQQVCSSAFCPDKASTVLTHILCLRTQPTHYNNDEVEKVDHSEEERILYFSIRFGLSLFLLNLNSRNVHALSWWLHWCMVFTYIMCAPVFPHPDTDTHAQIQSSSRTLCSKNNSWIRADRYMNELNIL